MASVRQNKTTTITNDENYDLATHMARLADSIILAIPVASQAERDALTKYNGLTVRRLDLTQYPYEIWDGTVWFRETIVTAGAPVSDGFWTITGGILKTITPTQTICTASLQMVRTGSAITINTTDSTLIIGMLPSGFRPPANASFVGTSNTDTGTRYAEPQLILNNGGSLVGRSTSGGPITIGVNYTLFISVNWYI